MTKAREITIEISLMILPIIFFAPTLQAFETYIPTPPHDSMYRYSALENTVDFSKKESDVVLFVRENTVGEDNIKKLETITKQQINSIEKSDYAIATIEGRSVVRTFLLGNGLGVLKFQLVQMKDQGHTLNDLVLKTDDNIMITQINSQIDALGQQRAKVDNFVLEQEGSFSLFGWLISLL